MNYAIFIPACFALNMAFGPNNLLAISHGAQRGTAFALQAGVGRLLVFVPMIALSGLGLGLILSASATAFTILKVAGAAYLIWIGIKILRNARGAQDVSAPQTPIALRQAFLREAVTAVSNPKAMLIFAAFLPQFVPPETYARDFPIAAAWFLGMEAVALGIYAAIGQLAATFAGSKLHLIQKVSGVGMVLFGALLIFARRPGAA